MRRAHVPGPALRALLLAAVVAAGARVQAEQVTEPAYEPGIAGALQDGLPPPQPALSGHLRESSPPRRQPTRSPAPAASKTRTVPEPASILLLVTGLIGLAARRHLLRNRT